MPVSEKALLEACRVLFGPELHVSRDFLIYLQLSGVKRAFRQRAKETHPDHSSSYLSREVADTSSFTAVREAYAALEEYICRREAATRPLAGRNGLAAKHARNWREHRYSYGNKKRTGSDFSTCHKPLTASRAYPRYNLENIPARRLKLGRFLYHAGAVEWQDVINALVWQRAGRPRIGELACLHGLLREEQARNIYTRPRNGHRFGEQAVEMGILSGEQLHRLIRSQQLQQQKIGRYFVLQQILAQRDLYLLIQQYHLHNSRFSKV